MVSPSRMLKVTLASVVVLALVGSALADMYLHHPPGSNDRNRERNENRDNGNRLFDSQNNGKGGYPWRGSPTAQAAPDPLTYYTGSRLRIEWTNQHACGVNPNVHCEILLQYACNDDLPGLRDGYPESENLDTTTNPGFPTRQFSGQGGQNQQGTNTIDDNKFNDDPVKRAQFFTEGKFGGIEFGLHEGIDWYNNCKTRQRNKGLYTSDQKLNGNTARFTRQNPNGNRRGLECPEERDYYPYWHPTPWRDVAVLVSNIDFCPYYQQNSQNVKEVGYCANCGNTCRQQTADNTIPIEEAQCKAAGGTWTLVAAKGGGAPVCQLAPLSRDNHLGNAVAVAADGTLLADTIQPEAAHYDWEIPAEMSGKTCIVRVRYNMSTEDYPSHAFAQPGTLTVGFNAANNCPRVSVNNADENQQSTTDVANPSCVNQLTVNSRPLYNRPYVDLFGIGTEKRLALAINTHQTGRTFQDRSYVFKVADPPATVAGRRIFNLNTRGRRGNIVQCYPAVEYDFVPARLDLTQGDVLHIQFHGSDFNAARNANDGEGNQYTDRFNLVQTPLGAINYPLTVEEMTLFGDNREAYLRWALLGQENCVASSDGANNEQNIVSNCGKLNRAPNRFPASPELGLVGVSAAAGEYSYMSTRNNNFSNRSMKGSIIIRSNGLSTGAIVAIAFSSIAVCLFGIGGTMFYGKRHPQSRAGAFYSKTAACFSRPSAAGGSTSRPTADLEYARSTNTTAM